MEFTLLWAALADVGSMLVLIRWQARRGHFPTDLGNLGDRALGAALTGLVVGRLAAMVLQDVNPLTHPADIVIVRSGVHAGFAALGALGYLAVTARRRLVEMSDALAPAALVGLAGWHAGCLFRGSCLGAPSGLPWAYALPGSTVTRHPVELYAALLFALAGVGLGVWQRRRPPSRGVVAALAIVATGGIRWATELMRPGLGLGQVTWYAIAIVLGLLGLLAVGFRGRASVKRPA
jgi:prolipoprotein diacylglyceryltransferase